MEKKYELTNDTIDFEGRTLRRIRALKDFEMVEKGDLGGFVESEHNLSQEGNCWLYGDSKAFDVAEVCDNAILRHYSIARGAALVCDNAEVYDNAVVKDNATIKDNAILYYSATLCDNAELLDNAKAWGTAEIGGNSFIGGDIVIYGKARILMTDLYGSKLKGIAAFTGNTFIASSKDFLTVGPIGSRLDYTTFARTIDDKIWVKCGCFKGTIDEFKAKVKETHSRGSLYRKEYLDAIKLAKKHIKIKRG